MGLAEALPCPLVGSLLFLWLLDASGVGRAGVNGSDSTGEKGEERRGLLGRDSQRGATHAAHSPSLCSSCSSHDGVRVSTVGANSVEPARQGQAQAPPALPFAHPRGTDSTGKGQPRI